MKWFLSTEKFLLILYCNLYDLLLCCFFWFSCGTSGPKSFYIYHVICSRPFAILCRRSIIPGTQTIGLWLYAEVMTTTGCSRLLAFPYCRCTNICRKTQQCFFTAYTEADVIRQVTLLYFPSYLQQCSSGFLYMLHILA